MTVLNIVRAIGLVVATLSMLALEQQVGGISFAEPLKALVDGYDTIVRAILRGVESLVDDALGLIGLQLQDHGRHLFIGTTCTLFIWPWPILRMWPIWQQLMWLLGMSIIVIFFSTPIVELDLVTTPIALWAQGIGFFVMAFLAVQMGLPPYFQSVFVGYGVVTASVAAAVTVGT